MVHENADQITQVLYSAAQYWVLWHVGAPLQTGVLSGISYSAEYFLKICPQQTYW